jgi:hypothetical protein
MEWWNSLSGLETILIVLVAFNTIFNIIVALKMDSINAKFRILEWKIKNG